MTPSRPLPLRVPGVQDLLIDMQTRGPYKGCAVSSGRRYHNMGTEPETQGSSSGHAGRFRKVWGSEGHRVGAVPSAGAKGKRAVASPSNSPSSTDLQAADGEAAPGTHQCGAGTAQVVAGETLFAPGETQGLGAILALFPSNPSCPAMSPFYPSADPETQVGEGRHTGTERQVHEKPSELGTR